MNGKLKSAEWRQTVYTTWAYNEIFKYIFDHPEKGRMEAIEEFLFMVDRASCEAKTGEQSFQFAVAYDTAIYVYDRLMHTGAGDLLKTKKNLMMEAEMADILR